MPSPAITPQQFVAKWRGDTRKDRSVAQEHYGQVAQLALFDRLTDPELELVPGHLSTLRKDVLHSRKHVLSPDYMLGRLC